jgi:Holliday junction resolvase RusA-like endonuclease/uncharacterized protein YbjQ (UPF0145 family)
MDRAEENRILTDAQAGIRAKQARLGLKPQPTSALAFFVPGKPCSKGSPTILRTRAGRPFVREKPTEVSWEETIRVVAGVAKRREVFPMFAAGPVAVRLSFILPRSGRRQGTTEMLAALKPHPDTDKLSRAVLDALARCLYADDCQVTELRASKRVAETSERPGVWIEVQRPAQVTADSERAALKLGGYNMSVVLLGENLIEDHCVREYRGPISAQAEDYEAVLERLEARAEEVGATHVVGLEVRAVVSADRTEWIAVGTACVMEKL